MKQLYFLASFFILVKGYAQPYTDYIGAGHNRDVIVTSSSSFSKEFSSKEANGGNTINGNGLEGRLAEASRLLQQASFGHSIKEVSEAAAMGVEAWIDDQMSIKGPNYYDIAKQKQEFLSNYYLSRGVDSNNIAFEPNWVHWRYALWQQIVYGDDQLRQRAAYALSQILVISDDDIGFADGLAGYYTLLSDQAFGNYRDLLYKVALHPCMGKYLSHLNNPKTDEEKNIHPDQNFAREIMQLFTIGLYKLNLDGSRVKDNAGNDIPTYNNEDIKELAKVFTGLSIGKVKPDMGDLYFGRGEYGAEMNYPMAMFEEEHEQGPKSFLGYTIPDGQSGLEDIAAAIDFLFNHQNTAPFIAHRLIQRFVTSNPSAAYVGRVAAKFVNDGSGVRGNLQAVIKAILMDEEARNCSNISEPHFGKFSEPVLRQALLMKGQGIKPDTTIFLNHSYYYEALTLQHPLSAPSVFNFYKVDHSPIGPILDEGLVSPEMQILNSLTVINYPNLVEVAYYYGQEVDYWEDGNFGSQLGLLNLYNDALDEETLINKLDLLYAGGNLSEHTRSVIKSAIKAIPVSLDGVNARIKMALYLLFLSPDFMVNK